jgi:hypothetical protein
MSDAAAPGTPPTPAAGTPPAPAAGTPPAAAAPAAGTPPATGTPPVPTPGTPPADGDAGKTYTQAELDALLSESRKEAAKYRTEAARAAEATKVADRAKLTEDEQKAAALADREKAAETRESVARERVTVATIKEAAAGAGVAPAKLALIPRLIDRAAVSYDADGEPTNVVALVTALLKEYPDFLTVAAGAAGSGSADLGARGGARGLTMDEIKKMTPEAINARWPEVQSALAANRR